MPSSGIMHLTFNSTRWVDRQIRRRRPASCFVVISLGVANCELCHDGAAGAFASGDAHPPILAFGVHPENMNFPSLQALISRGWLKAPPELLHRFRNKTASPSSHSSLPSSASAPPDQQKNLALFRNNCLSCHNRSSRAAAHDTAFVLEPGRAYSSQEIVEHLGANKVMGGEKGGRPPPPPRP